MIEAGIILSAGSLLISQHTNSSLQNSGVFWIVLAVVAAGALVWILVWSRMRPLYLPRASPAHHFRRARQKELRPR
jgi:hypothetical protein